MRALVTGAAGFIGSHLVERLLADGWDVLGVDGYTPTYSRVRKEQNLECARSHSRFEFVEADLRVRDPRPMLDGVDVVFHFAAEPNVRGSWDERFATYNEHNVLATHRILEAVRDGSAPHIVFSSASSVYGAAPGPWAEDATPRPMSPYGATKLAAENLLTMYADVFGMFIRVLRCFTVYGPRQRPDMAASRMIEAALDDGEFTMYGLGAQQRSLVFVDDVIDAAVAAADRKGPQALTVNIGGPSISVAELLALVGEVTDRDIRVIRLGGQPGDVDYPGASFDAADDALGWAATTALRDGLRRQVDWHLRRRTSA